LSMMSVFMSPKFIRIYQFCPKIEEAILLAGRSGKTGAKAPMIRWGHDAQGLLI